MHPTQTRAPPIFELGLWPCLRWGWEVALLRPTLKRHRVGAELLWQVGRCTTTVPAMGACTELRELRAVVTCLSWRRGPGHLAGAALFGGWGGGEWGRAQWR